MPPAAARPVDQARAAALEALRLVRAGKTRRAAQAADQAVQRAPGPLTFRLQAAVLREQGRAARSLASARAALAAAPDDPGARFSLARSLAAAGRTEEALVELQALLTSSPEHPAALRLSGELLLRTDPAAAEARFRAAVRLAPRSGQDRLLLSRALTRLGRTQDARAAEAVALALDPNLAAAAEARRLATWGGLSALGAILVLALAAVALPSSGAVSVLVLGLAAPLLPFALVVWAAIQLSRAEVDPPDPDLALVESALTDPEGSSRSAS